MHSVLEIIAEDPASAGPDLISLDDLKLALGITGTAEDEQLQAMITFQSRIIAEYCDRRFGLAEAMETFTFDRWEVMPVRSALTLSLYPVAEVVEISTGSDYDFDPATGRLWHGCGYWTGPVSVNYSGGYDLPDGDAGAIAEGGDRGGATRAAPRAREIPRSARCSTATLGSAISPSSTSSAVSGFLSAPVIDLIRPYRRLRVA